MTVGISIGATAIAALTLHVLGVGGYQAGEFVVAFVLGATALGPLLRWRGERRSRALYATALTVVAVVVSVPLSNAAPFSKGRLRAELDEVDLRDFEVVSTREAGHSWCRPSCPAVTRTWRGPAIAPRAAVTVALVALHRSGLLERSQLAQAQTPRVQLSAGDIGIEIAAERQRSTRDELRLVIRLASFR